MENRVIAIIAMEQFFFLWSFGYWLKFSLLNIEIGMFISRTLFSDAFKLFKLNTLGNTVIEKQF